MNKLIYRIAHLDRSYTAAQIRYCINPTSGDV